MHKVISPYQIGFIKRKSITDNSILTQEVVYDINQAPEIGNIIMKLDMVKAYNKVDCDYLCVVLRRMGFAELWIDRTWRFGFKCMVFCELLEWVKSHIG